MSPSSKNQKLSVGTWKKTTLSKRQQEASIPERIVGDVRSDGMILVADMKEDNVGRVFVGSLAKQGKSVDRLSYKQQQALTTPLLCKDGRQLPSLQDLYQAFPIEMRRYIEEGIPKQAAHMKNTPNLTNWIKIASHPDWYGGWLSVAPEKTTAVSNIPSTQVSQEFYDWLYEDEEN